MYKAFFLCFFLAFFLNACERLSLENDYDAARVAMQHYDFARAEKLLERYLQIEKDPELRWNAWERLLEISEQNDASRSWMLGYLETMLEEFANDPERMRSVLYRQAAYYESVVQREKASQTLQKIIETLADKPAEYAELSRRLAYAYVNQQSLELAEDTLLGCLGLKLPESLRSECLYDLAYVNLLAGKNAGGKNLLDQILDMEAGAPQIQTMAEFLLADMLEQEEKYAEALKAFENIRDSYPNPQVVAVRISYLQKKLKLGQ